MDVVSSLKHAPAAQEAEPAGKSSSARVTAERKVVSPPSALSVFVTCILMALLFVFVIVGTPDRWGADLRWALRALAALTLGLLLVIHTRRRYVLPQRTSHRSTKVWGLPEYQVNVLQRTAGQAQISNTSDNAGPAQARIFASAVIYPAHVRQRLTERYDPGQRTLTQLVTIDAQLPSRDVQRLLNTADTATLPRPGIPAQRTTTGNEGFEGGRSDATDATQHPAVILFPVLVPRKGEMVDNLRVLAADGSAVPVLSYRQYLQLVAKVLRTLLDIAYGEDISNGRHPDALDAERTALQAVMRRATTTSDEPDDSEGSNALYRAGHANGRTKLANPAALKLAAQLIKKLSSHYAVVAAVPCPVDGRFVVSYERMMTPTLALAPLSEGILSWLKARARLLLGSRPVDFSISLDNAWTTQSYHLIIDCQDGVFVGVQEAQELVGYLNAHWNDRQSRLEQSFAQEKSGPLLELTTPPPYYRFRRRAGQRYAHFYTRFFPEPREKLPNGDRIPDVRFRFYEVPPGSVFRALIASTAAALLIWLIGFVTSRDPDPGTDVPAFLLVFPAVAAAWLGFDSQPRRLLEGTLAARISLLATVLCSIAASGLFMVYKAELPLLQWKVPADMQILGITSMAWSALMLLALLNASTTGYAYLARTWEFIHLSGRTDGFGGPKEHLH
ncbi:hypothetical protein ACX27O_25905 [Micromonospora sp. SD19]|uniref:Uncharacterized protein n=1 Tax=Micromonospora parva TaxID=1464048 RepID=A0ABW6VVP5_9ACTN|nr:hypothetical protein [Micromonospora parva]